MIYTTRAKGKRTNCWNQLCSNHGDSFIQKIHRYKYRRSTRVYQGSTYQEPVITSSGRGRQETRGKSGSEGQKRERAEGKRKDRCTGHAATMKVDLDLIDQLIDQFVVDLGQFD